MEVPFVDAVNQIGNGFAYCIDSASGSIIGREDDVERSDGVFLVNGDLGFCVVFINDRDDFFLVGDGDVVSGERA